MGGETQQPHYQALYRACIKDAAVAGAHLMQATLARALQELPQRAAGLDDLIERSMLLEAVDVLRDHQQPLTDAFPQALLAEFAQAIAGDRASHLSFESLALMGEDQVQESADLMKAARELEKAVAPQLSVLEAALSAMHLTQGTGVQRHPLRPEIYARSIYRAARPATRACCLPCARWCATSSRRCCGWRWSTRASSATANIPPASCCSN